MEALQAATIVPARAMKVEGDSGSLEVGKRADLDVLDANPLDDIHNIRTRAPGASPMACCTIRLRCGRAWDSSLSRVAGIRAPESVLNLIEGRNPEHREGLLASLFLVQRSRNWASFAGVAGAGFAQLFLASGLRARRKIG